MTAGTTVRTLRLGTRGSPLALTQSRQVAAALRATRPALRIEITEISTQGDTDPRSLTAIGGTGVFAAALRTALADGQVDLAVHSLKDLPVEQPAGLTIAAVPLREDPRDALVARDGLSLAGLPSGARVGTGSPRRASQLAALRPDLAIVDIRGNVDTRIGAVDSGRVDAVVLAVAGLTRLGRLDRVTEVFAADVLLPAPGQGALAVECRTADREVVEAASRGLDNGEVRLDVTAERAVLAGLAAGCSTPVGALARRVGGQLVLTATVGGSLRVEDAVDGGDPVGPAALAAAEGLGRRVATALLERGPPCTCAARAAGAGRNDAGHEALHEARREGHDTPMGTH